MSALVPRQYPTGQGSETAVEFAIDSTKFRDAFAADLPPAQTAVMAATQRPVAELAFRSHRARLPGSPRPPGPWSPPATERPARTWSGPWPSAGAAITEVEGSHVIMVSAWSGRRSS